MLPPFITDMVDLIVPPRPTERVVRALTLEHLQRLGGEDGLPYHEPRVQALVWELKYRGSGRACALAGGYVAETLLAIAAEELGTPLLLPVPMYAARRRARGHNQTELLCKAALKYLNSAAPLPLGRSGPLGQVLPSLRGTQLSPFEYAPQALQRTVDTKTQQGLPRAVRLNNVKHSMQADATVVGGRACVVVDDVTTTGATLAEAKRALASAGARAVHLVALARS